MKFFLNTINIYYLSYIVISFLILIIISVFIYVNNTNYVYTDNYVNFIYFIYFLNIPITFYFSYYSCLDFFSKSILCLCVCVSFVVNNCLNSKIKYFILQLLVLYSFTLITFFFVIADNLITLFICYELLMIPSLVLIYKDSYSKKSYSAMVYFFLWTQAGSFLVLFTIIWLNKFLLFDFINFKIISLYINPLTLKIIKLFLFLGFGVKVPIFPFYRWLIQIHVEAPSGFSIFLSGFLVKTALFFFYKISLIIFYSFEYLEIFMLIGILQSSFKFWFQSDLKKIIAYATVQEMNIIFFILNFFDQKYLYIVIIFIISHGFISSFMFYVVELIYRRFLTRNCNIINNLWFNTPILAKIIFLKLLIFIGLPGFGKFTIEVIFYMFCFSLNFWLCIFFFIIINLIGIIGYSKIWLNVIFSSSPEQSELLKYKNINDITMHELFICVMLCFSNIILNFLL